MVLQRRPPFRPGPPSPPSIASWRSLRFKTMSTQQIVHVPPLLEGSSKLHAPRGSARLLLPARLFGFNTFSMSLPKNFLAGVKV